MTRCGRLPSDAVLLTTLLRGPLEARMADGGTRDAARAVEAALRPVAERLVMPRKTRDRIRQILVAQRRLADLRGSQLERMRQREFFAEAAELFEVGLRGSGASDRDLAAWRSGLEAPADADGRGGQRRRRAPRARRR
jgi:hypothetical protein